MKRNLQMRNHSHWGIVFTLCGIAIPLLGNGAIATAVMIQQDEPPVAQATTEERIAEIEGWIEQLSEPSLTKRRKAKEALVQADSAAIPHLAKAALSDKREWIVYSLEVLGILQEKSPNEETRKAARVTLQMLADSQQPSTAERAKQMLGSTKDEGIEAFPGWDDPNSGFAGGPGGAGRSVSVSSINGMKTIRIEEAGSVTTFRDEARGAIRVTVQDGDKKKDFLAKDIEDLRAKDPEAHALYEQHSNGVGGGINIGAFAGGFPNFGNNLNVQNMQNAANAGNRINQPRLGEPAEIQAGTGLMIQQLEELKRRLADHPEMTQMLDAQIQQLKQK